MLLWDGRPMLWTSDVGLLCGAYAGILDLLMLLVSPETAGMFLSSDSSSSQTMSSWTTFLA